MSAITIKKDLIHYEKLGRGRPVILVHGWIGSWRYWIPLMQKLHTQYSVYTLDLIGFGDSSKTEDHYTVEAQVKMLEQFMEQLGIPKAAIVGHGLGAMVVTEFALRNPDKVARMLLVSIPLFDPGDLDKREVPSVRQLLTPHNDRHSLSPNKEEVMREFGDQTLVNSGQGPDQTIVSGSSGIYTPFHELPTIGNPESKKIDRSVLQRAAEARDKAKKRNDLLEKFKNANILSLLGDCFDSSKPEYGKLKQDVAKSDNKVLIKSAEGFEAGEMLDSLRRVTAPIIAVHGADDKIIPLPDIQIWEYLAKEKEEFFVAFELDKVAHFPMLEWEGFPRLMTDFLTVPQITDIEKPSEQFKRRNF